MADLEDFKKQYVVEQELGITKDYGRIFTFIDFGNVNNWFNDDRQDADNKLLQDNQRIRINLNGLHSFTSLFSEQVRFYYGHDSKDISFISAVKKVFGDKKLFTKAIQWVRHHLSQEERVSNTRSLFKDNDGDYVLLPKCNFDVEITVDAIRLMDNYDTLALFSGDADFVSLIRCLKKRGKKVILFKGGNITQDLRKSVDKIINGQKIKSHIAEVKQVTLPQA